MEKAPIEKQPELNTLNIGKQGNYKENEKNISPRYYIFKKGRIPKYSHYTNAIIH